MSATRGAPQFEQIVSEAIQSAFLSLRVAGVGIVKSYDAAKQTCSVQPAVRRPIETVDGDVVQEADSIVQNVMVAQWGSASLSSHAVLAAGDAVLLVYLDYSPALWRERGAVSDAPDTHKNGPSYPVAIPFFRPAGGAGPDNDDSIGKPDGLRLRFEPTFIGVGGMSDFVAMAAKVNARLDALEDFALTHMHATAGTGPPVAAAPAFVAGGGDVSSTNLKAD